MRARDGYKKLIMYLREDEEKMTPEVLFPILNQFVKDFKEGEMMFMAVDNVPDLTGQQTI